MGSEIRIVGEAGAPLSSDAKAFYRDYWSEGNAVSTSTAARYRAMLDAAFPGGLSGKRLMEIGVGGEGGMIRGLMDRNEVIGLDASAAAVDRCRLLGVPARLHDADRERLPFDADSFDVVFAFEVCEHFSNPQFAIEEIRRVLRPGGRFMASTPNPLTHHWPRYFYPPLIEHDAFREFLAVNMLPVRQEMALGENRYAGILTAPARRAWSWIWLSENIEGSAGALFETGWEFWNRADEHGIRIRPMEAADLFRAAAALEPRNTMALGALLNALVYRVLNGEDEEFLRLLSSLWEQASSSGSDPASVAGYWLCLAEIELARFGFGALGWQRFERLLGQLEAARPGVGPMLRRQLETSHALFSPRPARCPAP